MARRRFFVEEAARGRAVVRGPHAHHLYRVLRVRSGQVFEVSDTRRLYLGRVVAADAAEVAFALEEELPIPAALPQLTLLAAIFKFDRFEWMIEKATELGVARILPVVSARTEKGLGRAAGKRVERWRRIGWEAAQQCRRLAPPEIADPGPLERAVREVTGEPRWMLDETLAGDEQPLAGPASIVLVGPEGGFAAEERQLAVENRFVPVSVGPLILRAETAAVAALAVLVNIHTKA